MYVLLHTTESSAVVQRALRLRLETLRRRVATHRLPPHQEHVVRVVDL